MGKVVGSYAYLAANVSSTGTAREGALIKYSHGGTRR
jgi:hypothetical protein